MPPQEDFAVHSHQGITVITPHHESLIGVLEVNRIGGELKSLIEEKSVKKLVLDLQCVKFAGSAFLGMLMELSNNLSARGGKLVLSHAGHVEPLLKVTRARGIIQLAPTTIAAMEMFQ